MWGDTSLWFWFAFPSLLDCCSVSHVQLFVTTWTVACQASLSMGFSRQEYWSGLPCPPPRVLPNPGIMIWDVKHLFMYLLAICISSLAEYSVFLTIFFWVICWILSCMSCLYMLDISPSSTSFANIFSHAVGCLLVYWWYPLLCKSF